MSVNGSENSDEIKEKCNLFRRSVASFLRDLATAVDDDRLDPEQGKAIAEIFLKAKLFGGVNMISQSSDEEKAHNDVLKFMALGWHIYTNLLND